MASRDGIGLPHPAEDEARRMLEELEELVSCESPSSDPQALSRCADVITDQAGPLFSHGPQRFETSTGPHLVWASPSPAVLLLGHFDTVWPVGTLRTRPFQVQGGRATGPGVFDMKAGIAQMWSALRGLSDRDGVSILLTCDEEVGAPTSRRLIEEFARGVPSVLVLEPSADGALKVARKGAATYLMTASGRAAHAGLEPELGVNATIEMAHQVLAVGQFSSDAEGTTVTPTLMQSGSTMNTVPAEATAHVDVRTWSASEHARVASQMAHLQPVLPGARLNLRLLSSRLPLESTISRSLYEDVCRCAGALGQPPPGAVSVGGVSDGNFTAALGIPTLDGLGAVGGGAHSEAEHVDVDAMSDRADLLSALLQVLVERHRSVCPA